MAHLVASDKDDFRRSGSGDGGVENHDAFGGDEAGDVSVDRGGFLARVHPEHTLGRNVFSGSLDQFLEAGGKRGIFLRERLEPVEQRIDHERLEKEHEQQDGQRREPKVKPPAPRRFANNGIGKPNQNDAQNDADELAFGPVPKPRALALHRKAVLPRNPVFVDAGGQLKDIDREDHQRRKDEGLEKALGEFAFG